MKRSIHVYLNDIAESITKIEKYTNGITKADFLKKEPIQDAVVRRLEIIGEAVKNIPESFRKKYPDIPWRKIAGTRDKLIHEYPGVDMLLVWEVIKKSLPELKKEIEKIKKDF